MKLRVLRKTKLFRLVISFFMVLGIFVGTSTSVSFAEGSGKEESGRKIKFNVISDSHVKKEVTDDTSIYWKKSLEDISQNFLDSKVLLHSGDLTNNGSEAEYNTLYKILGQNLPNHIIPMLALGNHDVRWLEGLDSSASHKVYKERYLKYNEKYMGSRGNGEQLYFDHWVDGYHFIVLNTEMDLKDNAHLSKKQLQWFSEKVKEKAEAKKPIFVAIHQTFKGTADRIDQDIIYDKKQYPANATEEEKTFNHEEALKDILREYPQTVIFTGHVHNGLDLVKAYKTDYGHVVDVPCPWYTSYGKVHVDGVGYQVVAEDNHVTINVRDHINKKFLESYQMSFDV
ncbi:metallophosphoesterase [Enterococcus faecalis]|nr:metallophosphoesterase [Enterococcus faecalis]